MTGQFKTRRHDPAYQKKAFQDKANFSGSWRMAADQLLAGARVLSKCFRDAMPNWKCDDPDREPPDEENTLSCIFLLYGFALENLFKARCAQKTELVENNQFKKEYKTHNLCQLAKLADINLSQEESAFLEKLTIQISANARYPTGTTPKGEAPIEMPDGNFFSPGGFNSGDIELCKTVSERVVSLLNV